MESVDSKNGVIMADALHPADAQRPEHGLHLARRGGDVVDSDVDSTDIAGFDAARMRARTLLTADEEKQLLRKIDWHIMTLCSFMFMLKNMDADNVSNARIMNLETNQNIMTQLGMSSDQYALLAVVYYIPYIVFEAPSNLLLKRMRPSRWQSRIMATWGIALCCHAAATSKSGIYAARFFLGVVRHCHLHHTSPS